LPDIDFNIRAGNTLVGFATYEEVKKALTYKMDFDNALEKIAVKAADLQQSRLLKKVPSNQPLPIAGSGCCG